MGTHSHRSNPLKEIVNRGKGYDMPSAVIDGMDARAVRDGLAAIVETVRQEPQPYWVEIRTYRYRGHSMSDPGLYRTKEELDKYKDLDPIAKLAKQLTDEGSLNKDEYDKLDAEAKQDQRRRREVRGGKPRAAARRVVRLHLRQHGQRPACPPA